jgi:2-methylcitrate dehydratase PrpD
MQEFPSASVSDAIAAHVVAASFDSMPPTAVHAARRALLDTLGVMQAATGLSADALAYRQHVSGQAQGICRIFGSLQRSGPADAAFANGALAHALDFGDCFDAGPAHPHAALVPALIAFADMRSSTTLGEFLCALAVGGDFACRLSLAPARPYEAGGWYPPPLVNLVSSAAACAKLLELDAGGIIAAMSFALLSGSFPAILKHDRGSPLRGTREAFAARGAVEAALLARAGAAGFADPLGGPGGFFDVYSGGHRRDVLLDQLGDRYLGTEVSFKPWPACRGTHAYIEAALELRQLADPADVQAVSAGVGPIQQMLARELPPWPEPISAIGAKFSIPYAVSVAFIEGAVGLGSFDAAHLGDERVRHFASKVQSSEVTGWGREHAASGRLSIGLADGTRHEVEVIEALGSPRRPLSDEALINKFADCTEQAAYPLTRASSAAVAEMILEGGFEVGLLSILDLLTARQAGP